MKLYEIENVGFSDYVFVAAEDEEEARQKVLDAVDTDYPYSKISKEKMKQELKKLPLHCIIEIKSGVFFLEAA